MHVQNPNYRENVERIMASAPFIRHLGIAVAALSDGSCESAMTVQPFLCQQDGFVHAGVLATIADHTAGAAAGTLIAADETILSSSFDVHLLRPARGEVVTCVSRVVRQGRSLIVCASDVHCGGKLAVAATVTLAVVKRARLTTPP